MTAPTGAGRLPGPRRGAQPRRSSRTACRCRRARPRTSSCCRVWSRPAGRSRTPGWRSSWSPTSPTWPAAPWTPAELDAMHDALRAELPLDDVVVCPHDAPGRLLVPQAAAGDDPRRRPPARPRPRPQRRPWATAGATSTPPTGPGSPSVYVDWGLGEPLRDSPDARFGSLARGTGSCPAGVRRRDGRPTSRTEHATRLGDTTREDLRRRRRPREHHRPRRGPPDLRVHHQPDADAQGRHRRLRGVRPQGPRDHHRRTRSPSRSSPTSPPRWCARPG